MVENNAENIFRAAQVVTCARMESSQPDDVGCIADGAMVVSGGRVVAVGKAKDILDRWDAPVTEFPGCCIVPGLVDAHTHPVFAGSRIEEFLQRAQGATYEKIHAAGGGINCTVQATRQASYKDLYDLTRQRLLLALAHGTTTIEAKSGYGLEPEEELRELRILHQLREELPLDMAITFLGAHAVPPEYKNRSMAFLEMLVEQVFPVLKAEELAEWIDIFCEAGVFNLEESRYLFESALAWGFKIRAHAEEFRYMGSAVAFAQMGATSIDHLLALPVCDIPKIKRTRAICTLMPTTSFFLGHGHYAPGRALLDAGVPVALGSDFNAGSTMCISMPMVMALAVLYMKFTPAEALRAATINAARALELDQQVGSLEPGKQADFLVVSVPDYREWIYCYGTNLVRSVYKLGSAVSLHP